MKKAGAWIGMLLFAITLMILGFEGNVGKALACFLVPSQVVINVPVSKSTDSTASVPDNTPGWWNTIQGILNWWPAPS